MTSPRAGDGARWALAATAAVLALAGALALVRSPPEAASPVPPRATRLVSLTTVGGENAALTEEALLFDPAPLFIPTPWNAAQNAWNRENPAAKMEPGNEFARFNPKWAFAAPALAIGLAEPIAPPASGVAAVIEAPLPAFVGFGREPFAVAALPPRGARLEVRDTRTGQIVLAETLADATPPGDGLWEPMELDAAVDAAGLVGPLVVSKPSDVDGIDNYFRSYLAQSRHLGQLLAPGFYHLTLGP